MMASFLLHEGAIVLCKHAPGQAIPSSPNPLDARVKVSGLNIVTQTRMYSVIKCPLTPGPTQPCLNAQWKSESAARRVKVGGVPVLLKDSKATCTPTMTGVNIILTQTRVKGV